MSLTHTSIRWMVSLSVWYLLRRTSSACSTRLGIDDDVIREDETSLEKRDQRQLSIGV